MEPQNGQVCCFRPCQIVINEDKKIQEVKNIFDEVGVLEHIKVQINHYHKQAQNNLEDLTITNKDDLNDFANLLLKREV